MNNREIKTVEDSNLKALSSSNTIFVDGTLSACPMFFYQLFTIHFFKNKTTIVADFEESIHAGAKIIWPLIQIIGCRFHLTQSWWRKIQEIGLTNEYKNKTGECGIWLRKIFGLSFLNPEKVSDCFIENFMAYSPNDPKILTFCDYLTENYINESSRFPPNIIYYNNRNRLTAVADA
ncbi:hypothetical protein AGLY_009076 [Aphis glycines]|uniref:MULE transposase domain-containing protein n=1 Tax=Aphis glycines TaxID=307491 RepID=A0A6G0TJ55_APHGL|nr:hypothetical protein AGLY_009076 [Aphis glycines]